MESFFFENPFGIAFAGILLVTVLGGAWLQTGKRGLLIGAIAAAVAAILLLVLERTVITETERVKATVDRLARIVETGDLPSLLKQIHPDAEEIKAKVSQEFPRYKIKEVDIKSGMKVDLFKDHKPPKAIAEFNVVVVGGDASGLLSDHRVPRFVILTFYKDGEDWKIWHYEHFDPTHGMRSLTDDGR